MSNKSPINENTITFGKFKGLTLQKLLRDRKYCTWFLKHKDFAKKYSYIYKTISEYNPRQFFVKLPEYDINSNLGSDILSFFENYHFFNLTPPEELKCNLSEQDMVCYRFYLDMIQNLKDRIIDNCTYDIKAPVRWLKTFEKTHELSRDIFKEFLYAHDLPNIPYIVEDIKKMGGVEYKGARSFIIAKERSVKQEKYWGDLLREKYGENIAGQYQYQNCIFDNIHINNSTLYECKLGLKDFNEDQHRKYTVTLGTFKMVYLVDRDCVIKVSEKVLYTTNVEKYTLYISEVPNLKNPSKFDLVLEDFSVKKVENISDVL